MSTWLDFWNRPHRIYVDERHLQVHYRQVAADICGAAHDAAVILDYGCGDALEAGAIAARVGRLLLYDRAPATRARLIARFAADGKITVLGDADLAAIEAGSLDLVVVNSVAQYLTGAELQDLLTQARGWISPNGRLLLADVIPPGNSAIGDAWCLLRTAWKHGFASAALGGLARTFFSDYRKIRRGLGLSTYTPDAITSLGAQAGLDAIRERRNFGFNQRRMTFTLIPTKTAR